MRNDIRWAVVAALGILALGTRAANPTIVSIDQRENTNRTEMHTTGFKDAESYQYSIWRRGGKASVGVVVSADYDATKHEVVIEVSHSFAPTPLSMTLAPGAGNPAGWNLTDNGVGTANNKKTVELSMQVANGIPIGQYTFGAAVREKGKTTALNRAAFPKPVVILFNPWNEDDSVYMEEKAWRQEYLIEGEGRYRTEDNVDRAWRYGQFDGITLKTLLRMLALPRPAVPEEFVSIAARSSPAEFSRAMAISIGKYVEGNWTEVFEPGETSPRAWKSSPALFEKFGSPPVKSARCWVYAHMLTSLFRCSGIPARTVSCLKSAHESGAPNGFVDIFEKKVGNNWVIDKERTADTLWGFHAWTEAWMTRPDRVNCDGWQAVDGTYNIGPAPVKAIAAKSGGNYDVDFVVGEVTPPVRFWRNGQVDRTDTTQVGARIMTKKRGVAAEENIVKEYKPGMLRAPAPTAPADPTPTIFWTIPENSAPGADVSVVAHMSNPGVLPVAIDLTVAAYAECYSQDPRGEAHAPESRQVLLEGGEIDRTETFTIPWSEYESFAAVSDHLRVDAFAVSDALDTGWPQMTYVVFDAPTLAVTRTTLPVVAPGELTTCAIELTNPFGITLTGCTLEIAALGGLENQGSPGTTTELISVGSLAPGASYAVARSFGGTAEGIGSVIVTAACDQAGALDEGVSVTITACVCDINSDGIVDDEDFVSFALAYDLFVSPPADPLCDFSRDGQVDDEDFQIFIGAYDGLLCNPDPDTAQ